MIVIHQSPFVGKGCAWPDYLRAAGRGLKEKTANNRQKPESLFGESSAVLPNGR
jgi:hypothetical protein